MRLSAFSVTKMLKYWQHNLFYLYIVNSMETPKLRACGFIIVRGEPVDSFLLMKHHDRWDLPKGHVDGDETDLECALRELREETGIQESEIQIDSTFQFSLQYHVQYKRTKGKKKLKEVVIFLARLKSSKNIVITEHQGFEWFEWNPPHTIQANTIDPLLKQLEQHFASKT